AEATEVDVGGQRVGEAELGRLRAQVVTLDVGDVDVEPEPTRDLAELLGQTGGVEAPGVGDDLDALLERDAERVLALTHERTRVAEVGVLEGVAAQDQHRELGEVVTGQVVELTPLKHLAERRETVAVEAGAVADQDGARGRRGAHAETPFEGRPPPAGRAKAGAIESHLSASAPTATRSVSSRCTRCVTRRQKSYADPVTVCAATSGPHDHTSPDGAVSSTRN